MAVSVAALNIGTVPFSSIVSNSSVVAYAESTDELADGEYPVNISVNCFETDATSQFVDYFRVDLVRLVIETNATSGEKTYKLNLPIDYKDRSNFEYWLFGYSYDKYTTENGVSFDEIPSQDNYVDLKEDITSEELGQLDDTSSNYAFTHSIVLNNLEDEVYLYFAKGSSHERLCLSIADINKAQNYEHYSPEVSSFEVAAPTYDLYYQDKILKTQLKFDCAGFPSEFYYEFQVDEGNGYSEPSTLKTNPNNGRQMQTAMLGELKYNDQPDASVGWGYVIKNRNAHSLTIKARVGAKYRDSDETYWSDYSELSVDIAKAGINMLNSSDKASVFTNSVTPRFFTSSYYMIPYDTSFSISNVTDESAIREIEDLLKEKTGRDEVDFSVLDLEMLNPNGEILSEIISPEYSSWSEVMFKAFILPSIKDYDANNMGVYRYEDGKLLDAMMVTPLADPETGDTGFGFYPDENGVSGTYVFIQKDYKGYDEWFMDWQADSFFPFEAHLFDKNDNLKKDECDAMVLNNEVYSYISNENGCFYVNIIGDSGNYIENIFYKDFSSDSFKEAEIIESVIVGEKTYPSVIRIPRTSYSAYIPLKFTINGTEKEVNLGISYSSGNMPMIQLPQFTKPDLTILDADSNEAVNLTNDATAYVSISAHAQNQKVMYTIVENGKAIVENQQYTKPFELKATSDEKSVVEINAWVEANDTSIVNSLATSEVTSKKVTFNKKGAFAETVNTPIIGIQYKTGDSLDSATFKVVLSDETKGAKIYYTTDGSEPTSKSKVYDGEFTVNGITNGEATVIKAIAIKDNANDSEIGHKTVEFKTSWWDNLLPNSQYTIPVKMINFMNPEMLSMGNGAIAGDAVFKIDANGNKTLTIPFKAINLGGLDGYMIHYWYFPDASKAHEVGWDTYMLDYECEYTFNSDGTIKTVTLPVLRNEELITCALESSVSIMGQQQTYIQPDYSSIIEEITGKKVEKVSIDEPVINTKLNSDKSSVNVTINIPESNTDSDAKIYYIVSKDSNLAWDDSSAKSYEKEFVVSKDDVDENGITNVFAIVKTNNGQSAVATKKIAFDLSSEITPVEVEAGKYSVNMTLMQFHSEEVSMGNASMNPLAHITVNTDGKATLEIDMHSLTYLNREGYLGWLKRVTKVISENKYQYPTEIETMDAKVLEEYIDLYDSFNDPKSEYADANVTGKWYPKKLSIPIDIASREDDILVQVYVPVMESIMEGGGTKFAVIDIDWDTLKQLERYEEPATTTTTTTAKKVASDDDLCKWAINDYKDKTGTTAASAKITDKADGKYTITLTDKDGKVLDTYVIDPTTGEGTNSAKEKVDLPQTGNNSMSALALAVSAFAMTGIGIIAVAGSGVLKRRKEDE